MNLKNGKMKRLRYLLELEKFIVSNPEILKYLPQQVLTELYYFQRCQSKYVTEQIIILKINYKPLNK